jgi:hypothetical protein
MVSKEMALKLKEIGLEWEPQRHDIYMKLYNQECPMQPRCDINEVLSALPELIEREREREAEKLIAAAEQRAEQAEADCIVMLAEVKQLIEFMNVPQERWPKVITKPHPGSALLAELEQLRNIRNAAEKLMKNICSYCPPWYREDISKCAKWCEMREKYELRQALAQAERGQE